MSQPDKNEPTDEKPRHQKEADETIELKEWHEGSDPHEVISGPSTAEAWHRAQEQLAEDRFGPERNEEEEWFWGR